jgi:hypothetical protein
MARLIDGCERSRVAIEPIGERDFGRRDHRAVPRHRYLRRHVDTPQASNGAEYT